VDSTLHYTVKKADVQRYGNWVYNHDFYAILNLAVGGQFDGMKLPAASAFPAKVTVDFVHVYKPGAGQVISALRPGHRFAIAGFPQADLATYAAYDFTGRVKSGPAMQAVALRAEGMRAVAVAPR
jgi:hypothetical protein